MYGPHIAQLNVYTKVGKQFNGPLWSRSGTHGNKWWHGLLPISNQNAYQVVFEGVRGSSYQGDIALDDIEVQDSACQATSDCDFENPVPQLQFCGWKQRPGDNFDWRRGQGGTPSINTGPATDHTLGNKRGIDIHLTVQNVSKFKVKFWSKNNSGFTTMDGGKTKKSQFGFLKLILLLFTPFASNLFYAKVSLHWAA